jgi:hypothetical protein
MSNEFEWAEEHIELEEHRKNWVYYFKNKFNGLSPDDAEWFGLNNLKETISLRKDIIDWKGTDVYTYKLMKISEHPQLMKRDDLRIITFDEYMDYINIWK